MRLPKVLIVEDEIIAATNLKMLCELWGYEVCPLATSSDEAITCAAREDPDIVLMDINLHGEMDGIEAAREIRGRHGLPVIFMSGYDDETIIERARNVDDSGYVTKPLDFNRLKQLMETLLSSGRRGKVRRPRRRT